jgi:hypothetical protein
VYVAREHSYDTYGSFDIVVADNRIAYATLGGSHAGLLAYADAPDETSPSRSFGEVPNAVRQLTVKDNVFEDVAAARGGGQGIAVRSSCIGGEVVGNVVARARPPGVAVAGSGFVVSANVVDSRPESSD